MSKVTAEVEIDGIGEVQMVEVPRVRLHELKRDCLMVLIMRSGNMYSGRLAFFDEDDDDSIAINPLNSTSPFSASIPTHAVKMFLVEENSWPEEFEE